MGIPASDFTFIIPFVALITFINLRVMKFCNACGRTVMNQNPFSPPKFCSKCGAALDK
jgi:rRNA maturation endonuclease Nob1